MHRLRNRLVNRVLPTEILFTLPGFGSRSLVSALVGLAFLGMSGTAKATFITFEYVGEISSIQGPLNDVFDIADPVKFSYTFDTTTFDVCRNVEGRLIGCYFDTITAVTVTIDTFLATAPGGGDFNFIFVTDSTTGDSYIVRSTRGFVSDDPLNGFILTEIRFQMSAFGDSGLITGDSLPTSPPDPELFDLANMFIGFIDIDTTAALSLTVTNLRLPVREVEIDIKPGSDPNSINLSSAGVIPVAILSSETFDALTVDEETIFLESAGVKMAGRSGNFLCHEEDVNSDGLDDLVCQVETAFFMIDEGAGTAELTAETFDGTPIRGVDSIQIVPDRAHYKPLKRQKSP